MTVALDTIYGGCYDSRPPFMNPYGVLEARGRLPDPYPLSAIISGLFASGAPGVWYDLSLTDGTLFQDAAGMTPVTAVEQPVGLVLDKSKGLVLGSELVVNGDFSQGSAGWTLGAGWSVSGGQATFTATGANSALTTVATTAAVSGRTYEIRYTVVSNSLNGGAFRIGSFSGNSYFLALLQLQTTPGTYVARLASTPSGTGTVLDFWVTGGATSGSITIDNISVRELPGNHAFQTTSANRPVVSARYNLLTKTEQFDVSPWTNLGTLTVTPDNAVAPNGTTTADKFDISALNVSEAGRVQTFTCSATTYAVSWYVKPGTITGARIGMYDGANFVTRDFTFATKTFGNARGTLSLTSTSYEELPNGWYRLIAVVNAGQASSLANIGVFATSTGTGWFWGADLRVANDGINLPPYQRVNTATDYDTAGFPLYLRFNGSTQFLQTNSIDFSSTDKVLVAAGVRKLSDDTAAQALCELSTSTLSNNGSFHVLAVNAGVANYGFASRGTVRASSTIPGVAPIENAVLTMSASISAPSIVARKNGVSILNNTADQGTGNYGNYPLYIGARAGTSLFFNGRLYSLIIAGIKPTDAQILGVETYINSLTKAF